MKKEFVGNLFRVFLGLSLFVTASCSSSVWNNPHGLLAGLFGDSSGSGHSGRSAETASSSNAVTASPTVPTTPQAQRGGGFTSLPPPTFIHIVPFQEGDGFYLQWTRVPQATDYLLYRQGVLVADVPHNVYRIHGLIPCRSYRFAIWSSNGAVISKKPLTIRARTLGCLRTR